MNISKDIDCSVVPLFFQNFILMPRQKYCEHPINHGKSTRVPKGIKAVSLQLSNFLISQYDVAHNQIRWLCLRCHTFESKKIRQDFFELIQSNSHSRNRTIIIYIENDLPHMTFDKTSLITIRKHVSRLV